MTIGTWLAACALLVAAVACGESPAPAGDGAPGGGAGGVAQGGAGGEGGEGGVSQGGAGGEGGVSQGGAGGGTTQVCQPGFARRCYGGPEGTAEVGLCRAGIELCLDDGSGFGACLGEVRPAANESCLLPLDEDCDGAIDEDCACAPGSVRECFSGPESALDVGPCRGGLMACREDGSGYGPCRGEVAPAYDDCATAADEDCSGAANEGCVCNAGEQRPCYEGPAGTIGNGACVAGVERCAADGRGFEGCVGQVLPAAEELCGNGLDDDCNGGVDDVADLDGDGFTRCDGDCCDDPARCVGAAARNPGAEELPTAPGATPMDEDCDGFVDEPGACDAGLSIDDLDPMHAANALELCGPATGLVSAAFVTADGQPFSPTLEVGLASTYGARIVPRGGERLLVLSTGHARDLASPDVCPFGGCDHGREGSFPFGFPTEPPNCPGVLTGLVHDDVGLELTLDVPAGAVGLAFDFRFFSEEYPNYLCSPYNDVFAAIVTPAPPGNFNGNVALDPSGQPITVNARFDVCDGCAAGPLDLEGTPFAALGVLRGGTTWFTASAPVQPGSRISLRLAIWDSGDGILDSTALIDDFRWIAAPPP